MAINEILLTVALVHQIQGGNPVGTATGFFYEKGANLFLVTNHHVVKDDKKKIYPETLRLRLHTDGNDATKNDDYDIALYDAAKAPLWKTDPNSAEADVAVLKLDRTKLSKFILKAWSEANFLPKKYRLEPGEDVFIIGFPLGLSDTAHNLPVLRGGMVAKSCHSS